MATDPQFAATPGLEHGQVSTANTNRDGTGTIATILTAGSNGTKIEEITVQATATTTAGMVRLYLHDGTNARLFDEFGVPAVTPSASVACWRQTRTYTNLVLPTGWSLRASTHNAETFNVECFAGDF